MNERIQGLWNKASSSHQQASTSWETKENFLTRFAQLVAEDCAKLAETAEPNQASDLIRQKFDIQRDI